MKQGNNRNPIGRKNLQPGSKTPGSSLDIASS